MFLDKKVTVENLLTDVDDTDQEHYGADPTLSGIGMNIQPASAEVIALSESSLGKTFTGFTTVSGILTGARVTVSGTGEVYKVKGVQKNDYGYRHLEIVLVKPED